MSLNSQEGVVAGGCFLPVEVVEVEYVCDDGERRAILRLSESGRPRRGRMRVKVRARVRGEDELGRRASRRW